MQHFLITLLAAFILSGSATAAVPCDGPGHGRLLIHGGGGAPETYTRDGLALCGGPQTRVVVVPDARGRFDPADTHRRRFFVDRWRAAGAANVVVLDIGNEAAAMSAIATADYIFFDGGDQDKLVSRLARRPAILAAIRRRHEQGALVGGMSAGAAAMPATMIRGGESASLTALENGSTELVPGLGFWPEVITDQHFVQRRRFARLASAVLDRPALLGVAIDEATAILVSDGQFEVFGNGTVTVFDARQAAVRPTTKGQNHSATGINVSILRAGDRFDWRGPLQP